MAEIERLGCAALLELEYALIPHGLHVIGEPPHARQRAEMLDAAGVTDPHVAARNSMRCWPPTTSSRRMLHALDGGYIRPAPGGDLLRTTDVLPTGRNLHGFDPFRIPSAFAVQDGARQADRLLARHAGRAGTACRETVAMVLWGTDNLKTEGGPIAQVLWLMGAAAAPRQLRPPVRRRADPAGEARSPARRRRHHPLRHLPRPAAVADQAAGRGGADGGERRRAGRANFIRKHALAFQAEQGRRSMAQAALRVFGNADGAYGANVNSIVANGAWNDEDELAEAYVETQGLRVRRRRSPGAAGRGARPTC